MPITASQALLFLGSVSATTLLSIGSEAPTWDPNLCSGPSNLTFPTSWLVSAGALEHGPVPHEGWQMETSSP